MVNLTAIRFFKHLPGRRPGLLFSVLFILGMTALIRISLYSDLETKITIFTLELILPVALSLVTSGLIANDSCLEILLCLHQPASRTLLQRTLLVLSVGALLGTLILVLVSKWDIYIPRGGGQEVFIWLSPLVFFTGLSSAAALWRGNLIHGVMATFVSAAFFLLLHPWIAGACLYNTDPATCLFWLATPFLTQAIPFFSLVWLSNRLLWLFLGVGLHAAGLALTRREEHLLSGDINS